MVSYLSIPLYEKPHPTTSPSRPELSQAGRTVLVLGGSKGIGHAIARNFCAAGAAKVIIAARRPGVLEDAATKLAEAFPKTEVVPRVCDMLNEQATDAFWDKISAGGPDAAVDVVVFSGCAMPAREPILKQGIARAWGDFEGNVHAPLRHLEKLYNQPHHEKKKFFLYVSTQDIHNWDSAPELPVYQLSKHAGTCAMQQVAREIPATEMQIISFHPGVVYTEAVEKTGYTRDSFPFTDENIPGQFAVWAASEEAAFLQGRFAWSNWDIDQVISGDIRKQIDADPYLLKTGVRGL